MKASFVKGKMRQSPSVVLLFFEVQLGSIHDPSISRQKHTKTLECTEWSNRKNVSNTHSIGTLTIKVRFIDQVNPRTFLAVQGMGADCWIST